VPTVSVIVPTKNRRRLLEETLQSVQSQTFHDWECLVVDDGSSDGTDEFMTDLASRDPRFKYLKREGELAGANVCRNQGIHASTGEFLIFLDSDDLLETTCLAQRAKWMAENLSLDFIVCHADAFLVTPRDLGRPASRHSLYGDLDRFLYFDLPWLITGPTWRRAALLRLGGFNENIPSWQDVDLHMRALIEGFVYLNLPITDYHVRWQNDPSKTSLQQRRREDHLRIGEQTIDKFETLLCSRNQQTWSRLRAIAGLRLLIAELWADQHRWSEAKRVWSVVRKSNVKSPYLYYGGKLSLLLKRLRLADQRFLARCIHYWKGLVRLRQEPRLVRQNPTHK
jgi:glycosyltransferase involved in cell wall biosynthesis